MTDTERCPVTDLATDYDIFDPDYVADPTTAWAELRDTCPIAHTDRWGGSWLPTRYADVQALAKIVPDLSSASPGPIVVDVPEELRRPEREGYNAAAPISADPPDQTWTRRALLPHFTPKAIGPERTYTEGLCQELIDAFIDSGECDGAVDYAQQIPPRVIAKKLGVSEDMTDDFIEWVRGVLELGLTQPELRVKYSDIIRDEVRDRRANPKDDLITALAQTEVDGEVLPDEVVIGMCNLQLVAGIDTTWSSIGSALWHFATHADDRRRMAAAQADGDDDLWDTAIEELLRFYAPVTMARNAIATVEYNDDVTFQPGDKILMNFPGANHDPEAFDHPEQVILDRQRNRHIAFGSGIHRCAGSNLARMEMHVALRTWFSRIPEFTLADPDAVTWAGGQVRGPRSLPIVFG